MNKYKTISNYHLATASTSGYVTGALPSVGYPASQSRDHKGKYGSNCGCQALPNMSATMTNSANGTGIVTAMQNGGINGLNQNTVALSSVVRAGGNATTFAP
jgi:hypothetical protein